MAARVEVGHGGVDAWSYGCKSQRGDTLVREGVANLNRTTSGDKPLPDTRDKLILVREGNHLSIKHETFQCFHVIAVTKSLQYLATAVG